MRRINTEYLPTWKIINLMIHCHWLNLDNRDLLNSHAWCRVVNYEGGRTEVFVLSGPDFINDKLVGVLE